MLVASSKENDIWSPLEIRKSLMEVIFGLSLEIFFLILFEAIYLIFLTSQPQQVVLYRI